MTTSTPSSTPEVHPRSLPIATSISRNRNRPPSHPCLDLRSPCCSSSIRPLVSSSITSQGRSGDLAVAGLGRRYHFVAKLVEQFANLLGIGNDDSAGRVGLPRTQLGCRLRPVGSQAPQGLFGVCPIGLRRARVGQHEPDLLGQTVDLFPKLGFPLRVGPLDCGRLELAGGNDVAHQSVIAANGY